MSFLVGVSWAQFDVMLAFTAMCVMRPSEVVFTHTRLQMNKIPRLVMQLQQATRHRGPETLWNNIEYPRVSKHDGSHPDALWMCPVIAGYSVYPGIPAQEPASILEIHGLGRLPNQRRHVGSLPLPSVSGFGARSSPVEVQKRVPGIMF